MGNQPTGRVRRYLAFIVLCLISTVLSNTANAATPGFKWAKTAGGSGIEVSSDIAVDAYGDSLIVGYFDSTNFYWDNVLVMTNTVRTIPSYDCFITLCNSNGILQWARKLGGTGDDRALCAAMDAQGFCYVAGKFGSTNFSIGNLILTNTMSNGNGAFFVAKFSPTGVPIWARCPDKNFSSSASGLVVDAAKNVYVAGSVTGTNIIGGTNFAVGSFSDVLLLKYDSAGNLIWGQHPGGSNSDSGNDLAVDDSGNLYLSAVFRGTNAVFGGFVFASPDRGMGELNDIVVAKYDPSGTVLWANAFGGEHNETARSIAVDAQHNCYIAGDYQSTNFVIGGFVLTNTAYLPELFVAKLSPNGTPLWAKSGQGEDFDSASKVAVDPAGNSYVGGYFQSATLTIDSVTVTNFLTNGFSEADAIVAKFDTDGNLLWTTQVSADNDQRVYSLGLSSDGLYATGWSIGTNIYFGNTPTTSAYVDMFITRLNVDFPHLQYALTNENGSNLLRLTWDIESTLILPQSSTNLRDWQFSPNFYNVNGKWTTTVPLTNQTFFRLQRY